MKKILCSQCGKSDDVMTPDEIWSVLSESTEILKYYEKGKFYGVQPGKAVCWSCVYNQLEEFLGDTIDFEEQLEIRKKYNETWAPEFNGSLHHIMSSAMENMCLGCGEHTTGLLYDELSKEGKKYCRKKLKEVGLRIKDVKRQFFMCLSCIKEDKNEKAEKRRKKKGPITREKADNMVTNFLDGIIRINKDDQFKSQIMICIVFGSYLSDKEFLNDIDIFVSTDWKERGDVVKDQLVLDNERDEMITIAAGESDHFQFHTWSTIWGFKAEQNGGFKYKYLYMHPSITQEKAEGFLDEAVKKIKDNPNLIIVE